MAFSDLHILRPHSPTPADREKISTMPRCACPRRYCWWWRSLQFDWHLTPAQGCRFPTAQKPPGWQHADTPCKRAVPESTIDHYEPREPHLTDDGLPVDYWNQ
jgi:hypothetical protein